MKLTVCFFIFSLLFSFAPEAQTPALTVPVFTFHKTDNSVFTNKNLAPGKLLFFFFFDSDCEHCQRAMKNLNGHFENYRNAAVYLISEDDMNKINGFINKYGTNVKGKANVTVLQDSKHEFVSKFQPIRYPSMFLYTRNKKLADYEDNEESMFRFFKYLKDPTR